MPSSWTVALTDSDRWRHTALAVAAAGATVLVIRWARSGKQQQPDDFPPNKHFIKWPVFGHLPAFLKLGKDGAQDAAVKFVNICAVDGVCGFAVPGGTVQIMVKDPELVKQLYVNPTFGKVLLHKNPVFRTVRHLAGNGLFTADDTDEMWGVAHRILTKPFSREGMMAFVPLMNKQADSMIDLLLRDVGVGGTVVFNELVTKMAFETISYCGMGTTFNSFDSKEVHPFVNDMNIALTAVKDYTQSPIKWSSKAKKAWRDYTSAGERLNAVVDDIIKKRRNKETSCPGQMPDLLDLMLDGVDPKTGKSLPDENIRHQIITFLIAGHDTTASAMAFFMNYVIADPRVEAKLVREIAQVVGTGDVKFEHLNKLKYMSFCQKEAMRLEPPARVVLKVAMSDGKLGKFRVKQGQVFMVPIMAVHLDETLWGPDAKRFVPERWEKGSPHPYAWLPFSTGPRGCIGQEFSLAEQKIALVKLFQQFCFRRPAGEILKLENRLFVGPTDYNVQVFERPGFAEEVPANREPSKMAVQTTWLLSASSAGHKTPLIILYGSNGGSTRDFAQCTALKAQDLGFSVKLATLNEFADVNHILASGTHLLVLSATYNGCPAENGDSFLKALQDIRARSESPLSNTKFAVFGCGNTQWSASYQVVPLALDDLLGAIGGHRLLPRHEGDSAGDIEESFQTWLDVLWPSLATSCGISLERGHVATTLFVPDVEVLPENTVVPQLVLEHEQSAKQFRMIENRELTKGGDNGSVRHIVFELAAGESYTAGDHLAVYPENNPDIVLQLMRWLKLPPSTAVRMSSGPMADKNDKKTVLLQEWLLRAVDLSKACTAQAITHLASRATTHLDQITLQTLSTADHAQRVQMPLIELLVRYPSIELSLAEVLTLLHPMKPRLYSISSSSLANPDQLSVTVGVLNVVTASGRQHHGVCSNFLASRNVGTHVWVKVKDTASSFRLPSPRTPVILIGPGTGLAPLRGFLQELQQHRKSGTAIGDAHPCAPVGDVHLFFGCRTDNEFLYEQELKAFEADGTITKLHVAFSRMGEKQYVQQLMRKEVSALWQVLKDGGHIFVCGDASKMAPDVRDAVAFVASSGGGMDERAAKNYVEELRAASQAKRYHEDVWAGNA